MNKVQKILCWTACVLVFCCITIGYAAVQDDLGVDGSAAIDIPETIYIYDVLDSMNNNRLDFHGYESPETSTKLYDMDLKQGTYQFIIKMANGDPNYQYYYDTTINNSNFPGTVTVSELKRYDVVDEYVSGEEQHLLEFKVTITLNEDVELTEDNCIYFRFVKRTAVLADGQTWFEQAFSTYPSITDATRSTITSIEIISTSEKITFDGTKLTYGNESISTTQAWCAGRIHGNGTSDNVWACITGKKVTIVGGDDAGNLFADSLKGTFSYLGEDANGVAYSKVFSDLNNDGNQDGEVNTFKYVTSITGLGNLNTSNCTTMFAMFWGCQSLITLDAGFADIDTSNVTSMVGVFAYCTNLNCFETVKIGAKGAWDTSNVTSFSSMFYACKAMTSIDLKGFDTSNVTVFTTMFRYCNSLTTLDLTSFDTTKFTSARSMFDREVTTPILAVYVTSDKWTITKDNIHLNTDVEATYKNRYNFFYQ